ncbi:hypothetical protein [Serratia quinivorans]|uniref:hypothetical protein n=1 Tax=Serratia quinivorans TaxID=137545 RepID=UPI0021BD0C30|nr:hypothetical protein [Serratia quinivorans]
MRFYLSVLLIVAMAAAVCGFAVPTLISARFSIAVLLGFALGALFPVVVAFLTYRLLYLPITRKCKR